MVPPRSWISSRPGRRFPLSLDSCKTTHITLYQVDHPRGRCAAAHVALSFTGDRLLSKEQNFVDRLWDFFCSLKLAIITLILLALTSIIGTIIEQGSTPEELAAKSGWSLDFLKFLDKSHQRLRHVPLLVVPVADGAVCRQPDLLLDQALPVCLEDRAGTAAGGRRRLLPLPEQRRGSGGRQGLARGGPRPGGGPARRAVSPPRWSPSRTARSTCMPKRAPFPASVSTSPTARS